MCGLCAMQGLYIREGDRCENICSFANGLYELKVDVCNVLLIPYILYTGIPSIQYLIIIPFLNRKLKKDT